MHNKKLTDESKERSKRILRFGLIALAVMLLNGILNFKRGLPVSGFLVLVMAFILSIILFAIYKGYTKGLVTAIVLIMNFFLVLISFAEGLKTGGYLFILPLLFALSFLMNNVRMMVLEIVIYLFITACAFCFCILFCDENSKWQQISLQLSKQMFMYNSICVVCLCTIFAYTGIYFERQYKIALLAAKNTAEMHELKIKGQNEHLQEIAFMNAHIVRSPLANILALTTLLDTEKNIGAEAKELINHLQTSAQQLDNVIKEIVAKTTDKKNE